MGLAQSDEALAIAYQQLHKQLPQTTSTMLHPAQNNSMPADPWTHISTSEQVTGYQPPVEAFLIEPHLGGYDMDVCAYVRSSQQSNEVVGIDDYTVPNNHSRQPANKETIEQPPDGSDVGPPERVLTASPQEPSPNNGLRDRKKGGRQHGLSKKAREDAKMMREVRSCWLCKIMRYKVYGRS